MNRELRTKLHKLAIRLATCFRIMFVYKHWFIVNLNRQQLIDLVSDGDFECDIVHHGLQRYNVEDIMKKCAAATPDVDHILNKAEFEAKATLRNKTQNPKSKFQDPSKEN